MTEIAPAEIQWRQVTVPVVIGAPASFPPDDRRHRWEVVGRGLWRATWRCRACGVRRRMVTVPGKNPASSM